MKILVISDSHGNIANLKHVLGFAKKVRVDGIIHCGDWDNLRAVETVLESGIPVYAVLGNADIDESIGKRLKVKANNTLRDERFDEKFLTVEIDKRKIGVTHRFRQLGSVAAGQLDILFVGHTHRQEEKIVNGVKTVNPGALENEISFTVYDTSKNNVEFINIDARI